MAGYGGFGLLLATEELAGRARREARQGPEAPHPFAPAIAVNAAHHILCEGLLPAAETNGTCLARRLTRTLGSRARIDAGTAAVLKAHHGAQEADRSAAGEEWRGAGDYIFTTGWGDPVCPEGVSSLMSTLIRRHNEPAEPPACARPHGLRHVHAATLLLAGVPTHVVAARLGHGDPSITLRAYAHVVDEQVAAVAGTFADIVGDAG
ncbi:hypothetical protein HDA32_005561 [Spinactinospora alkalitolerans]|uniref:Tyr recombinase domain-containing protein n=1 Tax=Spinactinospora alkalitolerans TaxID=687207 RepID=A0A852U2S0_9ACTN|nr:tyrosine-type recombinase/integrase [Spinactinospora alkalitolerans]NYE50441.1 hypothetical protein [Spinactinospora alkalitolerans]